DVRHLAAMPVEGTFQDGEVVEGHDGDEVHHGLRRARAVRDGYRGVGRTHKFGGGLDGDQQRIVMPVVAGLDLDDPVAARKAARHLTGAATPRRACGGGVSYDTRSPPAAGSPTTAWGERGAATGRAPPLRVFSRRQAPNSPRLCSDSYSEPVARPPGTPPFTC